MDTEAQNVESAEPQDMDAQWAEVMSQENAPVPEESAETESEPEQRPSSDDQDRNWRALREKAEAAERRSQMLESQISEYNSMLREFVAGKTAQEPEEEIDETDILTYGQTKKTIHREAKKIAEEIVKKTLSEHEQQTAPKRLKDEFSDFDSVVSNENVDYLIKNEPELAAILRDTKDQYKQGKAAYKFIKSLGIYKKDVESMKQDASRNSAKPVSPNLTGKRNSIGDANAFAKGLTPELKKKLYEEMIESRKRVR